MRMQNSADYNDILLQKGVDKEAMSDGELRDFAAALIASPGLAEEFVEMRRIIAATDNLPREQPSPHFVDHVMSAVALSPRPASRFPRVAAWTMAVATIAAVSLAGWFLRGNPLGGMARLMQEEEWIRNSARVSLWETMQPGWNILAEGYRMLFLGISAPASLVVGVILFVMGLNFLLARGTRVKV